MPREYRFVADHMVGKLEKWLRLAGYDTVAIKPSSYADIISLAKNQNRIILSRNSQLFKVREIRTGAVKALYIESDMPKDQFRQVIKSLGDKIPRKHPRCSSDNQKVEPVSRSIAKQFVPAYVWQTQIKFDRCPKCNRFFWQGTHWQQIDRVVNV